MKRPDRPGKKPKKTTGDKYDSYCYIPLVDSGKRLSVGELAELGGVTRRTVRYYVQEGLIPAPLGVGRGDHYSEQHLDRLLRVKEMQEEGLPLGEIRERLTGAGSRVEDPPGRPLPRFLWTRIPVLPGLEIHVSHDLKLPTPRKLQEIVELCRRRFHPAEDHEEEPDA
jgi:DNA-binding transcriptional MerR regulator